MLTSARCPAAINFTGWAVYQIEPIIVSYANFFSPARDADADNGKIWIYPTVRQCRLCAGWAILLKLIKGSLPHLMQWEHSQSLPKEVMEHWKNWIVTCSEDNQTEALHKIFKTITRESGCSRLGITASSPNSSNCQGKNQFEGCVNIYVGKYLEQYGLEWIVLFLHICSLISRKWRNGRSILDALLGKRSLKARQWGMSWN